MKKNTVITIIIAALLCVVLLAMNPGNMVVSAEQTVVFSETITGSDTLHVVTFNYPDYRKTLFVEDNASLGTDLLLLPESEEGMVWNWVIDGTESYLTADTAITENMSVTAVQKVDNLDKDFMNGASGVIVVKVGGSSAYKDKQAALLSRYSDHNESNGRWLAAAVAETSTSNMTAWTFEFAGSCRNNSSNDCYYYVRSSDGKYLNVTSDALSVTGTPAKVLVHKNNLQDSFFYLGNYEGTRWVNLKKDNPEWGFQPYYLQNDGTKLYFYTGASSSLVTLSFDVTGGNRPAPLSYTAYPNDQIILPGYNGTRNGHVFVGWTEDQVTVINPDDTYSIPDTNKTLYAVFDETPTLWLNPLNDGPAISYAKGSEGFPTVYPSSERDGYRLVGWAKTPLSNEAEYEVGDPVKLEELTEDMTLYAVWQKISTLTFVPEAGSPIKITSDVGAILDLNHLEGVRPAGRWMYTDESGTSQYVNSNTPFTTPDHDMTLYAVHDVTVTFNGNGADNGNPALIESYTGDIIVLSQQAPVSRENYTLLGWKDQSGEFYEDSYVCKQTDDVLTAVWGYTVTFDVNGSKTNVLPVEGRTDDDSFVIPEFTGKKGNNDFLGWTTKTDENGKPIYEQGDQLYHAGDRLAVENDVVAFKYYAIYNVTLTFNSNSGGNISPARSVPNLTPYVDKVDLNKYTADFGTKTFFGWSETKTNTDVLPDEYTIGGTDHTLYAVWGSTVEFDVRGIDASVKSDSDWPETVRGLTTQTFKTAMLSSKYGRSFKGWTDGTNFYEPDVEVPFPNVNKTLYAVWDGSVTVRFDVNGGTAADLQPITQQVGTEFDKFPAYEGTKTGFKFIGWTDSNNLKDGKYHKVYKAGDKYYIPLNADTNIKFYAAWDVADTAAKDNVKFGIRLDGSIPYEPSNYNSSEYTTRAGIDNGNVLFDGVVSSRQWVADSDPSIDKLNGDASDSPEERYYIVNSVTSAVGGQVPTSEQIKKIMKANGRDFDPETEYVLWYVLKWQGNGEGRNLWHVDGVILKKDLNSLHYEGNFDGKADNMPTGFQFMPGQEVTVGDDGKLGNNTNKIPVRGDGYQFMGWNTKADGSGTAYQNGTKFTPTEKNTVLYAQWQESVKTVKLKKEWSDNDNVRGLRPESLLVTLNVKDANGNTFKTYRRWLTANSTDAEGNPKPWYIAVDIPAFDSAGREVRWEWIEGNNGFVPNYKEVTPRTTEDDLTTITNELQLINVSGTKTWKDRKTVHDPVTVQLYADGVPLAERIATASDGNLTYTFTDLPEYTKEGSRIIYTVREQNPPAGYEVSYDGMNVTNTHYYVTITAENLTKVYDGTPLVMTETNYTVVEGSLRDSDSIQRLTLTGSRTDAGKTENITPTDAKIVNEKDEDVTSLYTIDYKPGSLTVTRKPVIVTAPVLTKVYGQDDSAAVAADPAKSKDVTVEGLVGSETISYEMSRAEGEDVRRSCNEGGTCKDEPYPITFYVDGQPVSAEPIAQGNYLVTYVPGSLTITPKPVTVSANNAEKIYGDADPTWKATISGTLQGESVAYEIKRSENDNENTGRVMNSDGSWSLPAAHEDVIIPYGEDYQGGSYNTNYAVKFIAGDLTINPRRITITANGGEKQYDGTPLYANKNESDGLQYVVSGKGLAYEDALSGVEVVGEALFVTATDVPSIPADGVIKNAGGEDVSANYDIDYVEGALKITPRYLAFRAKDGQKVYDGTPLIVNEYTLGKLNERNETEGNSLAEGDSIAAFTIRGEQLQVGGSDNKAVQDSVKITRDDEDVTSNYNIAYFDGWLQVTGEPALIIRAESGEYLYDGIAHENENYTAVGLVGEDRIAEITVSGEQLNVGTSANTASGVKIVNRDGVDVTLTYDITYFDGSLTVVPRPIAIRAASDQQVYNGRALINEGYTVESRLKDGSTLAPDQTIRSVQVYGSQTSRGISDNVASAVVIIDRDGNVVYDTNDPNNNKNYDVEYIKGKLTVDPLPVVVKADSFIKEYDQLDPFFTAKVSGTLPGEESLITYDLSREEGHEDPGEYPIIASGRAVQGNYDVTYEPGTLTIIWNPTAYTVSKVWVDDSNRDGIRPVSLAVTLVGSDGSVRTRRLTDANGWTAVISDLPLYSGGAPITYTWTEEPVDGYTASSEVSGNVTTFTNTHEIARTTASVNKIWDDRDNAGGGRPASLGVILRGNGETILGVSLNESNGWSATANNLPLNENGTPISYVWYEQTVGGDYYAVSSTTSGNTTTLVNSNLYRLTIHYRYADGTEAFTDYVDRLGVGETFAINSPELQGYTASLVSVVGLMPAHDVEFTVIYAAEGQTVVTPTPTPNHQTETPAEPEPEPLKDIPEPRDVEPDEEHPVVVLIPTILVDIDDLETALGLGEVNHNNSGYALE